MNSPQLSDMVTASMTSMEVASTASTGSRWLIYALFLVAGLFVGGAWSAYKAGNRILMAVAGAIAAVAAGGGIFWMIGAMT